MFHIATIIVMGAIARQYEAFSRLLSVKVGILATMTVGSMVLIFSTTDSPVSLPALVFSSLLIGVGTGGWLVCWCESFVAIPAQRRDTSVTALGILVSILLFAVLSFVPLLALRVITVLLPFASLALSVLSFREMDYSLPQLDKEDSRLSPRLVAFCLVYSIPLGYFALSSSGGFAGGNGQWLTVILPAFIFIVIVLILDRLILNRFQTTNVLHIIIPISIGGLLLTAMFGESTTTLSGILIYSSQQLIIIMFYTQFAAIARSGKMKPAKAFAIGVSATDAGYVLGMLLGEVSLAVLPRFMTQVTLAIVYLLALFGLVLLPKMLNREERGFVQTPAQTKAHTSTGQGYGFQQHPSSETTLNQIVERYSISLREKEMLGYILTGKSVPAIAAESFLSRNTVKTHMSHIYSKLGVHSRDELILFFEEYEQSRMNSH
jgi:DNA-binding NarL/FixJ family response regulator